MGRKTSRGVIKYAVFKGVPMGMNPYTENWYERDPKEAVIEDFEAWVERHRGES